MGNNRIWIALAGAPAHIQLVRAAWIVFLFYSERVVFHDAANDCQWPTPSPSVVQEAFNVLLVSDPQIIDHATYPDLPAPALLFPLVRHFSDHYLRRAWQSLVVDPYHWSQSSWTAERSSGVQQGRRRHRPALPDAVLWMGDLTDGGRRDMTEASWKALHNRFERLFSAPIAGSSAISASSGRLVLNKRRGSRDPIPTFYIAGNHDLGLPLTVGQKSSPMASEASQEHFLAKYGVQVDSHGYAVTSQPDAERLSLNARLLVSVGDIQDTQATHEIVLVNAQDLVGMEREGGGPFDTHTLPEHAGHLDGPLKDEAQLRFKDTYKFVESIGQDALVNNTQQVQVSHVPRVLLTHVPLHRPIHTSCNLASATLLHGVERESSTPLHQGTDRYSTYQNLIGAEVTDWLLEKIDPSVVFSGDDHDHCEVMHPRVAQVPPSSQLGRVGTFQPGEIPELTVKSLSMTEGVRRPGFARLSLFARDATTEAASMAYTPCLLPDQIAIWTQSYVPAFLLSVVFIWAAGRWSGSVASSELRSRGNFLPVSTMSTDDPNGKNRARDMYRHQGVLAGIGSVCLVALPFWLVCQLELV